MDRLRDLFSGPASAMLVLLMLAGCLFLWIGIPLGWLWIGSQIQGSASLGTALMATMAGVLVSIVAMATILVWLNRKHAQLRDLRRRAAGGRSERPDDAARSGVVAQPRGALEPMLVVSAGVALVLFAIWFFGFAGASPIPLNLGY